MNMKIYVTYVLKKFKIKMIILIVIIARKNFVIVVMIKQEKLLVLVADNLVKCSKNKMMNPIQIMILKVIIYMILIMLMMIKKVM